MDKHDLLEALAKYGRHLNECKYETHLCSQPDCGEIHETPCSCGLADVLSDRSGCPKHGCAWTPITSIGGTYMGCLECNKEAQELFDKLMLKVIPKADDAG